MLATHQADAGGLRRAIKYRPDIDGLRAVAVTSVVAGHAGLGWAAGGFVGVDVFFVISGYLIGTLVYKEIRGSSFSLAQFYARRAKRILPALFGVLIFCYVLAFLLLPPMDLKSFSQSALASLTSSSNFYFWRTFDYFQPDARLSPLLMTWSLGIEEQFYLLFPLLLLLMRKMNWQTQFLGIGGLAALSAAASVWGTIFHPSFAFYLLPTRAWELSAGVLLAILEANRGERKNSSSPITAHVLSAAGLSLIGAAIFLFNQETPYPGYEALLPVAGAALVVAARDGVVNCALSWRPVVFVGLVSYSWYLWHWPMLSFARIVLAENVPESVGVSIALVSFLFAVLSYKFIEQPFRASTTAVPLLLKRYAAVLAAVMLPSAVFYAANGLPQRNRAAQAFETADKHLEMAECLAGAPDAHPLLRPPCVPPGHGRAVALIGDSHAAVLAGALRSISEQAGYRLIEITEEGCPALDGASPVFSYDPVFSQECSRFNRESQDYISRDASIQVVVIAAYWSKLIEEGSNEGDAIGGRKMSSVDDAQKLNLYQSGLDRLVTHLEQDGKIVYLVQDNPRFAFNPTHLMLNQLVWPRRVLAGLLGNSALGSVTGVAPQDESVDSLKARMVVAAVAAAHPATHLIDLRSALCTAAGCSFAEGDRALYLDNNHLSSSGAQIALAGLKLP